MLKKISLGLACAGLLLANTAIANTQLMQMGTTITYELKPQEPLELINFTFWTIHATCKIKTQDESDDILAKLLNRSGVINGRNLEKGDSFTMTVYPKDKLHITAESRAKVELTNLGLHTVKAVCST